MTDPCPYCEGKGYTKSKTTVCAEVLRLLQRDGHVYGEQTLVVTVHPEIGDLLVTVEQSFIEELEKRLQKKIVVHANKENHLEAFQIRGKN